MKAIAYLWNTLVRWGEEVYDFRQRYHRTQFNDRYL